MLWRFWRGPEIREVRPMTVVADQPGRLVLWLAPRTPVIWSPLTDGRDLRSAPLETRFDLPRMARRRPWFGTGILKIVPPDRPWSVWLFWDEDADSPGRAGAFRGWYGNLEAPHRRWTRSDGRHVLDTSDHVLDVWCPPHGPPQWKDEDEFAMVRGRPGWWDDAQADRIRAAGEELFARAVAREAPFDPEWTGFRPDPGWPVPDLPADWATGTVAGPGGADPPG